MRIVTLVKRVPDSRAAVRVRSDGSGIEAGGLKFVCDPFDEFGVAEAVLLREQRSDVEEIIALSIGDSQAAEVLRYALAMGADRAVHVESQPLQEDPSLLHDEIVLARLLAAAIQQADLSADLILCGKQNIDNDAGELGPALAELLDLPHVGAVTRLEVAEDGSRVRVHRRIEGAEEVLDLRLPALITCEKGLIEPRTPPLPKLMKARKQPVETVEVALEKQNLPRVQLTGMSPPPSRTPCRFIEGEPPQMAAELVRLLREEANVI